MVERSEARGPVPAPFTPAWLAGDPAAVALLSDGFGRERDRAEAVRRAGERRVEPSVLSAIAADTDAQRASLAALASDGGVAVVTGQQAGLFGGPLYTLYKAASAIACAEALSRETGAPCAPVFWLQNEDHDFAEIAACTVLGADGRLHRVAIDEADGDAGRSIRDRRLGDDVSVALDRVEACLGGLSDAAPTMAVLRRCWRPGVSPDAAFRAWIDALFAEHGLLVLDPGHPALAAARRRFHLELLAPERIARLAQAAGAAADRVAAAGFAVQVHVRPGSPLSFVHRAAPDGPRCRVEPDPDVDGGFRVVGGGERLSVDALRASPGFSTSALSRPLLQDTWLPTALYVGGPGEIAYFAQLPPVYAALDLPMPLVAPRARLRVVDDAARRGLAALGLPIDDPSALVDGRDALAARIAARSAGGAPDALAARLLEPVRAALDAFAPEAASLDPALARAADKTGAAIADAVGKLTERYRRTLAQRDGVAMDRLERVLARLYPEDAPQERVHAWPWYGARLGVHGLVDRALAAVVPFDGALRDLVLDGGPS